jgi:hypothetical protein
MASPLDAGPCSSHNISRSPALIDAILPSQFQTQREANLARATVPLGRARMAAFEANFRSAFGR